MLNDSPIHSTRKSIEKSDVDNSEHLRDGLKNKKIFLIEISKLYF